MARRPLGALCKSPARRMESRRVGPHYGMPSNSNMRVCHARQTEASAQRRGTVAASTQSPRRGRRGQLVSGISRSPFKSRALSRVDLFPHGVVGVKSIRERHSPAQNQ
jgi:hypothetical protein